MNDAVSGILKAPSILNCYNTKYFIQDKITPGSAILIDAICCCFFKKVVFQSAKNALIFHVCITFRQNEGLGANVGKNMQL